MHLPFGYLRNQLVRKPYLYLLVGACFWLAACDLTTTQQLTGVWYRVGPEEQLILYEFSENGYYTVLRNGETPAFQQDPIKYKITQLSPIRVVFYRELSREKMGKMDILQLHKDSLVVVFHRTDRPNNQRSTLKRIR